MSLPKSPRLYQMNDLSEQLQGLTQPSSSEKLNMPLHVDTDSLSTSQDPKDDIYSPGRNPDFTPAISRQATEFDLDHYFHGPLNSQRHSKWPIFLRLRGSVLPALILPLLFVSAWATAVTAISELVHDLSVNSVLLTVLGFVVGLALSFRSTTAYERYNDGRKYWAQLMLTSRNMARLIWVHAKERSDESEELGRYDLLAKLTAINLLNAFAVALKHRLRFEPSTEYPDLEPLISHLDTFASRADQTSLRARKPNPLKAVGEYLGVSFAESNPRKLVKRSKDNLGNLPLEILTYLSAACDDFFENKQLGIPVHQTWAMNNIGTLADVLTGTERVLNTPLPIAYSISISQITWVYILILPFQLQATLRWLTIPATLVAAYIILGLSAIGREIENPFGHDVNDLPLDDFCRELAADIDALTASPAPTLKNFVDHRHNKVMYPMSFTSGAEWSGRTTDEIRAGLRAKATTKSAGVMMAKSKAMAVSNTVEV